MCKRLFLLILVLIVVCCVSFPVLAASDFFNFTFSEPDKWLLLNWEFDPFMVIFTIPSDTPFTVDVTSSSNIVTVTLKFTQEVPYAGLEAMTVSYNGDTLPVTPTSYSGHTVYWNFERGVHVGYLYGTAGNVFVSSATVSSFHPEAITPAVTFNYVEPEEDTSWLPSIGDFFTNLKEGLTEALSRLGTFILDGLKDLFVPSEDYFTGKVDQIKERFSFYEEALDFGDSVKVFFTNMGHSSPPSFEFSLSAPDSKWFGGAGAFMVTLDFSWYAPYKAYVDVILTAFILLSFFWRMFLRLPGIISGMPAVTPSEQSTALTVVHQDR